MSPQRRRQIDPAGNITHRGTELITWRYRTFMCFLGMILLLSGCDSDSDNTGGSNGGSISLVLSQCQPDRKPGPVPCTLEYNPVCGLRIDGSSRSYDNDCVACSDLKVNGYWQGECATVTCTEPRPKACTREYVPVCGQLENGTVRTMPNACEACAKNRVVSYVPGGECF